MNKQDSSYQIIVVSLSLWTWLCVAFSISAHLDQEFASIMGSLFLSFVTFIFILYLRFFAKDAIRFNRWVVVAYFATSTPIHIILFIYLYIKYAIE